MQERIVRYTSEELDAMRHLSMTDWERIKNMKDEDIDFSDIPELDEEWFRTARRPGLEKKEQEQKFSQNSKDSIFITLKPKTVEKIKRHKSWRSMLTKEIEKLVANGVF